MHDLLCGDAGACKAASEFCNELHTQLDGQVVPTVGITTGYAFSGLVGSQQNTSRCEYTTPINRPLITMHD